jgi:hypothetical protein
MMNFICQAFLSIQNAQIHPQIKFTKNLITQHYLYFLHHVAKFIYCYSGFSYTAGQEHEHKLASCANK